MSANQKLLSKITKEIEKKRKTINDIDTELKAILEITHRLGDEHAKELQKIFPIIAEPAKQANTTISKQKVEPIEF